jgi:hypothetical protein
MTLSGKPTRLIAAEGILIFIVTSVTLGAEESNQQHMVTERSPLQHERNGGWLAAYLGSEALGELESEPRYVVAHRSHRGMSGMDGGSALTRWQHGGAAPGRAVLVAGAGWASNGPCGKISWPQGGSSSTAVEVDSSPGLCSEGCRRYVCIGDLSISVPMWRTVLPIPYTRMVVGR